jgi:pimeloyl-ACP methyl ester carboxylesterase
MTPTVRGVDLAVTRTGVTGAPAVVALHGWMCDSDDLGPLAAELAIDHEVLRVDLRGHGGSAGVGSSFTLADFADDVADLIADLGLGAPVVLGHSMGAAVAVETAVRHPAAVGAVVAVDAPWLFVAPEPERVASAAALWSGAYAERADRIRAARRPLLAGATPRVPAQAVAAQSFGSLMDWDGPAATARLECPLLAIVADANWAQVSGAVADSGARLVHVPGTGHWVPLEAPAVVADLTRRFRTEVIA